MVGFVNVWLIEATPMSCAVPPVIPPVTTGTGQVYVVPVGTIVAAVGTLLTGVTAKRVPLQIVAVWAGISGLGLTVTVIVNVDPTQDPAAPDVGVTL